ncbi:MAG: hypothetical protein P8176_10705, partial [Gammaproteobacteria bacterium]
TLPRGNAYVTLTVQHWIPVFTRPAIINILLDSLRFLSEKGLDTYIPVLEIMQERLAYWRFALR